MGKKLCFIGAGNMAEAMIRGLLQVAKADEITASDPRPEQLERLHKSFGIVVTGDNLAAIRSAEVVVLSVKPQSLGKVLDQLAPALPASALVLSIAAGTQLFVEPTLLSQASQADKRTFQILEPLAIIERAHAKNTKGRFFTQL